MNSFLGLLKKDIKLSRMWLLVWICGIIFLLGTGHIIASRTKEPLVIFGFFVAVAFFLLFLSPVFVFYHLRKEGNHSFGCTIQMAAYGCFLLNWQHLCSINL